MSLHWKSEVVKTDSPLFFIIITITNVDSTRLEKEKVVLSCWGGGLLTCPDVPGQVRTRLTSYANEPESKTAADWLGEIGPHLHTTECLLAERVARSVASNGRAFSSRPTVSTSTESTVRPDSSKERLDRRLLPAVRLLSARIDFRQPPVTY